MKSKIIIAFLALLLAIEFALAAYAILAHQWLGLVVMTILIFAVMYLLDRGVRRMRGELPPTQRVSQGAAQQSSVKRGKPGSGGKLGKPNTPSC